jgi:diacylglycerol kinase (ATP)
VLLLLAGVPLALWLTRDGVERALLIGSLMLALVIELLNAGIEAAVDRISLENHPFAKRAKDIGSAAVMLALVNAAMVWLLVLL